MVYFGTRYKITEFCAVIYHNNDYLCGVKSKKTMVLDNLKDKYRTVCDAPTGNGFLVEHMPEFFTTSDIDDCSPHVHSFYEILWFQEGEGRHTVDFIDYDVKPGTIFFFSPGQIHHFDRKHGYKGVAIKMCTDFMKDAGVVQSNLFLKYNAFHTYDTTPYYVIDDATAAMLQSLVDEMESEAQCGGQFGNIDILKSLLCIFLAKVQRHGLQESEVVLNTFKSGHQLFIQFRRLVEQEYATLHTVQEYADRLNVAVRTLNKCVNECSRKSPLAFINDRIILEAKRMVRYTSMMIKEIAYELGYDDPSYFVKFFKRQTGSLPSDFREQDTVTIPHPTCNLNYK